ncbi:MAG TPA: hypothetical protein VFV50_05845, partial [Bdellovibrionales bacterium]|nr:hypothetical protein [Bdellovibrionales bacterium]
MKAQWLKIAASIFALMLIAVGYNNCSSDNVSRRNETITGNPNVELSFGPYASAAGLEELWLCVSRVDFALGGGAPYQYTVNPNVEILLSSLGAEFGTINVPNGTYVSISFQLASFCDSGKSVRVKNANGEFSSAGNLGITFTGTVSVTETRSRLVLDTQPLVTSVAAVTSSADLASALASANGAFTPETLPTALTVEAAYPVNGLKWNDWIKYTDTARPKHRQDDVACAGTETGTEPCLHAGERKKVVVQG